MTRRDFPVHSPRYLIAWSWAFAAWLTVINVVRRSK
jgi:hypothetical protein